MRLIDADGLIKNIKNAEKCYRESKCMESPYPYKQAFADGVGAVADLIVCGEPTIEKRKHGHWIYDDPFGALPKCSECGCRSHDAAAKECAIPYCPYCGAVMDEEVSGK